MSTNPQKSFDRVHAKTGKPYRIEFPSSGNVIAVVPHKCGHEGRYLFGSENSVELNGSREVGSDQCVACKSMCHHEAAAAVDAGQALFA